MSPFVRSASTEQKLIQVSGPTRGFTGSLVVKIFDCVKLASMSDATGLCLEICEDMANKHQAVSRKLQPAPPSSMRPQREHNMFHTPFGARFEVVRKPLRVLKRFCRAQPQRGSLMSFGGPHAIPYHGGKGGREVAALDHIHISIYIYICMSVIYQDGEMYGRRHKNI